MEKETISHDDLSTAIAETQEMTLQGLEGVANALQILVLTLFQNGSLDPSDYTRALIDYQREHIDPDSFQASVFDRILDMLTDDQRQALLRRLSFRLIPGKTPARTPSASPPAPTE